MCFEADAARQAAAEEETTNPGRWHVSPEARRLPGDARNAKYVVAMAADAVHSEAALSVSKLMLIGGQPRRKKRFFPLCYLPSRACLGADNSCLALRCLRSCGHYIHGATRMCLSSLGTFGETSRLSSYVSR